MVKELHRFIEKFYLNYCKSQYLDVQKMENKNVQKIELRIRNIWKQIKFFF